VIEQAEGNITVKVKEKDGTRIFRRNAMRLNGGGTHTTLIGELDGVRCYVRERDGRVHVIMTDEDLYE
jgi:hypothetical protein